MIGDAIWCRLFQMLNVLSGTKYHSPPTSGDWLCSHTLVSWSQDGSCKGTFWIAMLTSRQRVISSDDMSFYSSREAPHYVLLLLSQFSHFWLSATPEMAAHQAPPCLGFSRQEHWSGLPFPSPVHASEMWKWSRSVVMCKIKDSL